MLIWFILLLQCAALVHLYRMHVGMQQELSELRKLPEICHEMRCSFSLNRGNFDLLYGRVHRLEQRMHSMPRRY